LSDGADDISVESTGSQSGLEAGSNGTGQEGEQVPPSSEYEKDYAARALKYMSDNYGRKLSLSEVAESIGVTGFYLSHLMSRVEHKTFSELLTAIRVEKATELLREGKNSIQEIGALCGYPNVKYFYRILKKQTGMTAREIQKQGQRKSEIDTK
ncbi:MAG: AraC family transcriptional regulator, partial [Lachnospiraceae bacterium]|nr:AraC family transcriptional regulator [Lachnospiraceae bacterium]